MPIPARSVSLPRGARAARVTMSAKIPGGKPTDDTKKKPAERRRNRTNYRCSKCGQPKRGHVCPYQPRVVKDPTAPAVPTRNAAVQVEMDERLAAASVAGGAGLPRELRGDTAAAAAGRAAGPTLRAARARRRTRLFLVISPWAAPARFRCRPAVRV